MSGELVSVTEAAEQLGITPDAARRAVQRGTLKATRVGSFYVVTLEEVERYRAEHLGRRGRPRKDQPG